MGSILGNLIKMNCLECANEILKKCVVCKNRKDRNLLIEMDVFLEPIERMMYDRGDTMDSKFMKKYSRMSTRVNVCMECKNQCK